MPGGQVVLELSGNLQFLRVGEWALEGGLVHLVVYYWGRGWNVLLVRDLGCAGFLSCFCKSESPVFDIIGGFLHEFGLYDGAQSVQYRFQARQLAGPETVGAPSSIGVEKFCSGRYVLRQVGPVL